MERPSDVENGYSLTAPLVYHFGHKSPDANTQLYNQLVSQLAEVINMRSEFNNKSMSVLPHILANTLPSYRQHLSYDDCLAATRDFIRTAHCFVVYDIYAHCAVICTQISSFYVHDDMLAWVLAMTLSVCLSQVTVLSKWMDRSSWFLACRLLLTCPTLCCKVI